MAKKKEKQIQTFFESIFENIPDMVFIKEAENLRFVRINKAGEDLLGLSKDEIIGRNDYDFFPKQQADFFTSKDRSVFLSNELLDIPEEVVHTRLKGERILHTKKLPILDSNGKPKYLLGISEDITDKKALEALRFQLLQEKLAHEETLKGIRLQDNFISLASHELRTPITALKLQLEMILKSLDRIEFSKKETFLELIQSSQQQLDRFSQLSDEILEISRIHSGRLKLEIQDVNLTEVILEVLDQCGDDLAQSGCSVATTLDSSIHGQWDRSRIKQVIYQLLSNAIKYGAGKMIEIKTSLDSKTIFISVKDHGVGIAHEDHEKIFNRFERTSMITQFRGLGLGLYISRQIIAAHGGKIGVKSELGEGATFTVELPTQARAESLDPKYSS